MHTRGLKHRPLRQTNYIRNWRDMFLSHGSIVKYKNQLLEYMKHTFELLFYGIYTDIQEFLNVKKSMVALLTPKCVSKYAMLDCIEGNDPT